MIEVQSHGFEFEKWVRDTFFGGYSGGYVEEWDIPAEYNNCDVIPLDLRNLPVSIKTSAVGAPIGLGDVIRQRRIKVSFVMIVGFWTQRTAEEKWFEDIGVAKFTVESWGKLWGELDIEDLNAIDARVKNLDRHYSEVREEVQNWKREITEVSKPEIVINPKIDSKRQRRIQCSLPFAVFWNHVGRKVQKVDYPNLFNQRFPNPMTSSPRKFNQS